MSSYLDIAEKQLDLIEATTKEAPPGDERARCLWIALRIREMLIQAIVREEAGKSIVQNERNIEEMFKMLDK